ncbi:MAG: hypothetical protein LBJ12_05945 [Oscillospiraceae bacterium]|jgi:hypothetical protein|nr:hypothetical protein [Oscillospiraceae bacterium]
MLGGYFALDIQKKINAKRMLLVLCVLGVGFVTTEGVRLYISLKHFADLHPMVTTGAGFADEEAPGDDNDALTDILRAENTTLPPAVTMITTISVTNTADGSTSSVSGNSTIPSTSVPITAIPAAVSSTPTTVLSPSVTISNKAELLERYIKAVNARRNQSMKAKKTVNTKLEDFDCPPGMRWFLQGELPIIKVDAGAEAKRLFGNGIVESSAKPSELRTAVSLGAGDITAIASSSGDKQQIRLTLPSETNPGASGSKISKLTRDFPLAESYRADIAALIGDGSIVVDLGAITVTTGETTVAADFSASGELIRETIAFDFKIRMEKVSVGTRSVKKLATLSWGEVPGRRTIVIEY